MSDTEDVSMREKLRAFVAVATYRPALTAVIVVLSFMTTLFEGISVSFLLPIIEQARSNETAGEESNQLMEGFVTAYEFLGIPFTLEFIILGVATMMTARITMGFLVSWLIVYLQTNYIRDLQNEAFDRTLNTRLSHLNERGSDDVLNTLVTRTYYAEPVIGGVVEMFQQGLLILMYLAIAFYLAPALTVVMTAAFLGIVVLVRWVPESGYTLGDRIATAHERIQTTAQAGTQGIRDVKLFGLSEEIYHDFRSGVEQYTSSTITHGRNQAAIESGYRLLSVLLVIALIYFALTFSALSLGGLGVFIFAVYRLAPQINSLNALIYQVNGSLPNFVRTRQFIRELEAHKEPDPMTEDGSDRTTDTGRATEAVPDPVREVAFEEVGFSYDSERVLHGISFSIEQGEFVALVGPSGAGKSTIAALVARLYEPDEGRVLANGTPITRFDVDDWRSHVAVVPQDPYIFNETLRYNVTVGARNATEADLDRACEAAQVTEFLDELPEGYDTELGDDGVRLSGGQRQRVAIARALLKDADVLVFDEATSDLDSALEERIHTAIESLPQRYAIIVIAHRLGTIIDADRIYTVKDGRITEMGEHQELIENDETYAKLYARQALEQ